MEDPVPEVQLPPVDPRIVENEQLSSTELIRATADDFPALPPHNITLNLQVRKPPECHPIAHSDHVHSYRDAAAEPPLVATEQESDLSVSSVIKKYLDFPFLTDPATIEYLRHRGTKLMIILRGCPGSGKSMVVQKMKEVLDGIKIAVASADDYWMRGGVYTFDPTLLSMAHDFSKAQCERFCGDKETHVVIVDNTNIMYWEFLPYLKIAHRFNFVTLLVEPKTPWRYDAQELFARNIHNVGLDVIESRVKKLQEKHVFPAYYGWMLSAEDSAHLKRLAVKLAIAVLQVEELRFLIEGNQDILMNQFIRTPNEDMVEWKERCDLYHCTAFYTGYGRRPGIKEYEERVPVQQNLGRLHHLEVIGFLITPGTISFRLQLSHEQLKLWNQEEDPEFISGSRAHITIQTARGVPSLVSGMDMIKLGQFITSQAPSLNVGINAGLILTYPEDFWYLSLEKPMFVPSLFAPFFTRDRVETHGQSDHVLKESLGPLQDAPTSSVSSSLAHSPDSSKLCNKEVCIDETKHFLQFEQS